MPKTPDPAADASSLEKADVVVAQAMASAQDSRVVRALGFVSELADQPQMIALNSAVLSFGLITGNPRMARTGVRMLAAHLLATGFKHVIKRQVDRTRPYIVVDENRYWMEAGHGRDSDVNSFPSGHTAGAVAAARAFGRDYPEHRAAGNGAAAAAALIQIPRCKHYPSDIVAGAAIGIAAEALVSAAATPLLDFVEAAAIRQRDRQGMCGLPSPGVSRSA